MKASLTESDYQLIQKLEIKRTEEQKEPLTALKIAKVLTQYQNNNDTKYIFLPFWNSIPQMS